MFTTRKLNQAGFAALEVGLFVVILAIIGGTGYFVWHSKQASNKNLAPAASQTVHFKNSTAGSFADCKQAAGSKLIETFPEQCVTASGKTFTDQSQSGMSAPSQLFIVIKEWGVRFTITSEGTDLYYAFPRGADMAYFSAKPLVALAPDCAPDKVSIGLIFRQSTSEYQAAIADQAKNGTNIDNVAGTIHIGDYYYGLTSPQAGCVNNDNQAAVASYNAFRTILNKSEPSLAAVPGS